MNQSDLAPIRERLETLKRASQSQQDISEPLWDQPRSPELPVTKPTGTNANPAQLAATVQALQQRSQLMGAPAPTEEAVTYPPTMPPDVSLHWQRLQQEALLINELAQKQTTAIQNFKRSADRLSWSLRTQPPTYGLQFEQFCELQNALVSQVTQDESGKLILTNVTVDLYIDERHASQTAQDIRAFSQARIHRPAATHTPFLGLIKEPLAMLEALWQNLHRQEGASRLTPLDIIIWGGGGLIGRLALELALAALPGLWPWLVGITIGAVAFALYRLLLAPRPDMAFVIRLLLALIGLALGGQL